MILIYINNIIEVRRFDFHAFFTRDNLKKRDRKGNNYIMSR